VVVLAPLVHAVWLPLVFLCLALASGVWRRTVRETGGLAVPVATHALADLGVVLGVRWLILS